MIDLPAAAPADESFAGRVGRHVGDLLRLAWPVMLSRAGILLMAFCDIAMLGRYGPGAVGEANLGIAIFVPLIVIGIGLGSGVIPVVSQAYGAGHWAECGAAWRRAMVWGGLVSLVGAAICWQGAAILAAFGQTPELAARGGAVAVALAPGVVGQVLYAISAFYLEATRRPMPALVVMIGANIANFGLNWLMIWGHWGLPELGAPGAALASTIVRIAAALALIGVIVTQPQPRAAGVLGPMGSFWGPGGWRAGRTMRRLGLSAGLSNGAETVGFAAMSLIAGTLGMAALDAYSLSHNLLSTLFMVGLGLAVATGVRVGIEIGRGRPDEAAFAGWTGFATAAVVMGTLAALVILGRDGIARVYTDDPDLAARAAALFVLSAIVFVPDSLQVVMGQVLRAIGDAWVAVGVYAGAFIVLMVPLGWLAVAWFGFDERGIVLAVIAACTLATALLAWRFRALTRSRRR